MKNRLLFFLGVMAILFSCNRPTSRLPEAVTDARPISICRFDKELYAVIETGDSIQGKKLVEHYPQMCNLIGKAILHTTSSDTPDFVSRLLRFYSEPTLKKLFRESSERFDRLSYIEQELGNGFAWLHLAFPDLKIPKIYTHVSGFNQNILVTDSLLSISIDKYLGTDYSLYDSYFEESQQRVMKPSLIAPDAITGWLMSEYTFEGNEDVLLDRMIYEGKFIYLKHRIFPHIKVHELLGYTEKELTWCTTYEGDLWRELVERKHLYAPHPSITNKYFKSSPCLFLSSEAPGNLGTWIGWKIVCRYMEKNKVTIKALLQNNNSREILKASHFKP